MRALLDGRNAVIPEDIQSVLPGVASHRLQSVQDTQASDGDRKSVNDTSARPGGEPVSAASLCVW